MDKNAMIIVTGAAGFIGSCMVGYLNRQGYENLVIVDDFDDEEKKPNYINKKITERVERDDLFKWLSVRQRDIRFVFHLGARTDTTDFDYAIHEKLNVDFSKQVWNYCAERKIPLIYASSAATYGGGEFGYDDDHQIVEQLKPLNPYGVSKNEFDKWALRQPRNNQPPSWAGLKFFNVYGPNEFHKGRMASVAFHSFNQIKETGKVKLFRSHNAEFKDGEQLRDFIYVEDVVKIMFWIFEKMVDQEGGKATWAKAMNGIYNVGTGKARTFNDLVNAIFSSMNVKPSIEYINTPEDIRDKYQYFTEANMAKLRGTGYEENFFSLEDGVNNYVKQFLLPHDYY